MIFEFNSGCEFVGACSDVTRDASQRRVHSRGSLSGRFRVRFVASSPFPPLPSDSCYRLPLSSLLTVLRLLFRALVACPSTLEKDREIVIPETPDVNREFKSWKAGPGISSTLATFPYFSSVSPRLCAAKIGKYETRTSLRCCLNVFLV